MWQHSELTSEPCQFAILMLSCLEKQGEQFLSLQSAIIKLDIHAWHDGVRIKISRSTFSSCWVGHNFCLKDEYGYLLAQMLPG